MDGLAELSAASETRSTLLLIWKRAASLSACTPGSRLVMSKQMRRTAESQRSACAADPCMWGADALEVVRRSRTQNASGKAPRLKQIFARGGAGGGGAAGRARGRRAGRGAGGQARR